LKPECWRLLGSGLSEARKEVKLLAGVFQFLALVFCGI
jgi:hypothetical protein